MKKIDFSKISKITEPFFEAMDKIGKLSKLYRLLISLSIIFLFAGPIVYFLYIPKWEKEKVQRDPVGDNDEFYNLFSWRGSFMFVVDELSEGQDVNALYRAERVQYDHEGYTLCLADFVAYRGVAEFFSLLFSYIRHAM